MRLIDVDNISFKEINKALEDLSWWCDTNEEDRVVYIPSSNLIKDIGRIKDYLEYIKQQPTAFDKDKVKEELDNSSWWTEPTFDEDGWCNDDREDIIGLYEAIEIVERGGIDE